ncbi:hypothetical protein AB0I28_32785 [Phytomonospora sp. NPDC050363]|uniref:hypothetical protein n=1 Tax=Phytomonospora sp. NPDC050363 TaxID=3155642 RepID=UPI0033C12C84
MNDRRRFADCDRTGRDFAVFALALPDGGRPARGPGDAEARSATRTAAAANSRARRAAFIARPRLAPDTFGSAARASGPGVRVQDGSLTCREQAAPSLSAANETCPARWQDTQKPGPRRAAERELAETFWLVEG